jgi:hypothetical protein
VRIGDHARLRRRVRFCNREPPTNIVVLSEVHLYKVHVTTILLTASLTLAGVKDASAGQQESARPSLAVASSAAADQQSNVPAEVRQTEVTVERAAKRFRMGAEGGIGLDPELIMFGVHGAFGPIFKRNVEFRPGVEFGIGEVTTTFGVNLDVLYTLPGATRNAAWTPYLGIGPNFGLSHRGFRSDDIEDEDDIEAEDDVRNRFDFGDTDFEGGVNFIAGVRQRNGMFLEMKATAYGVSNVRLLVGFNF